MVTYFELKTDGKPLASDAKKGAWPDIIDATLQSGLRNVASEPISSVRILDLFSYASALTLATTITCIQQSFYKLTTIIFNRICVYLSLFPTCSPFFSKR